MDPLLCYLKSPTPESFADLVRAYYKFVWDVALRVTGDREDAGDVCHDVFLKLFLEPPKQRDLASERGFLAWRVLSRVAHSRRSDERRRQREEEAVRRASTTGLTGRLDAEDLHDAIAALPDELRLPLELYHFGGYRQREIAEVLGLTAEAIGQRLERARRLLRRQLGSSLAALIAARQALRTQAHQSVV